jgi:hypothetical protein
VRNRAEIGRSAVEAGDEDRVFQFLGMCFGDEGRVDEIIRGTGVEEGAQGIFLDVWDMNWNEKGGR